VPFPSQGQATLNISPPPQPSNVLPATLCHLEGGVESSGKKGLWDPGVDITSYLEDYLLHPEDKERMVVYGGHHLLQEAMKQCGQALATSFFAAKKLRSQETTFERVKQDVQHKMVSLQQEVQSLQAFHQQTEQLLVAKTKEAVEQATRLAEQNDQPSNLQQEVVQKDKFFADEVEVYKGEVAQVLLVGFEVAVKQASNLHPDLDYSQLGPSKRVVDEQVVEK